MNYFEKMEYPYFYHVYNRTNNREICFKQDENYRYFLEKTSHYLLPCLDICAYCLMPTHFHFVVSVKENYTPQQFEEQFRCLLMSYTKAVNKKYNRNGSLWQSRFRRVLLKTEAQIMNKICYVHHNPIHHGISINYEAWPYSSYKSLFLSLQPTQIARQRVLAFATVQEWLNIHEYYKQNFVYEDEDQDNI